MAKPEEHGTLRIRVTSVDGSIEHPFRREQVVGDVHQWAYEKLVRDKGQVPIENTWMEFKGPRVDDSRVLSSFDVPSDRQPGREVDLTLNLAWTTQGGLWE